MKRKTREEFIRDSIKIHGDIYDYSLVDYVNSKSKVKIVCENHGIFYQRPNDHLSGNSCPSCHGTHKMGKNKFIIKSIEVHGDKYDYSKVEYINNKSKVEIYCPIHGKFLKRPRVHLGGGGCQKCSKNYKINKEEFIKRSNEKHNGIYDYSLVEIINTHTKVKIICEEHGIFEQKPYKHYSEGHGCPNCRDSKGVVNIINILSDNNIIYEREVIVEGCVSINNIPLRFDFYLPQKNIYIEYDGAFNSYEN